MTERQHPADRCFRDRPVHRSCRDEEKYIGGGTGRDIDRVVADAKAGNGEEVRVVRIDPRAQRNWTNGFTSLAQTYADLFASPGRSADELRRALWTRRSPPQTGTSRDPSSSSILTSTG